MDRTVIRALEECRAPLRRRWEWLLHQPASELELGEIIALQPLLDPLLDELYDSLRRERMNLVSRTIDYRTLRRTCSCGRNPLLACFLAGEKALIETFARRRKILPLGEAQTVTALVELHMIFRKMAGREVESFCSGCISRATGASVRSTLPSDQSPASPPNAPRGGPRPSHP